MKNKKSGKDKAGPKNFKSTGGAGREIAQFARMESGIGGLDAILQGGFLRGGTYLIIGPPGSGKTIFANQLCFHEIERGGKAIYVTLLAESHARMFGNLKPLAFFEQSKISSEIQYISAYSKLEKDGLEGLLETLQDMVQRHKASVLVIDGIASADSMATTPQQFKKFVHHLNSVLGIAGCTTFLLSSAEADQGKPEYTMVDGIVALSFANQEHQTSRMIEVRKFRGSGHFHGRHAYEIGQKGIEVYPRVEVLYGHERASVSPAGEPLKFGLPELDEMFAGGLTRGSVTALLGPVGTGKTQLGMQFLIEGARLGQPSLLLSMYEHPSRLQTKLERLGMPISKLVKSGKLSIQRRELGDQLIDKTFDLLISTVREKKIQRLFIDGIHGLRSNTVALSRIPVVLTAGLSELRSLGVTTMLTEETDVALGAPGHLSNDSAISDNVIEFQHAELDGRLCQTFAIRKTRETAHDFTIRELLLSADGPIIGGALEHTSPSLPIVRRKGKLRK